MFGILNINKPPGWTSRDVVNRVHRFVRPAKAGHAGTLDPLATGVLLVAVGQATRLIQYAHRLPKFYQATFQLGQQSPSDDVETQVEPLSDVPIPAALDISTALPKFVGQILQRPPDYSAVSVDGRRAYKLARRGESVKLQPRQVSVQSLELVRYEYPELVLDLQCGSGTYVRALGRDLAESLGTAAVMSALERKWIGSLDVSSAVDVDQIEGRIPELLLSPVHLVEALSRITLDEGEIRELHHGRMIRCDQDRIEPARWPDESSQLVMVARDRSGRVVSVIQPTEAGQFRPVCNFSLSD